MIDSRTAPYAALLLRIALGLLFLAHGLIKLLVQTVPGLVERVGSLGYPTPAAYLVLLAELGGGLALIAGLWTRWIAIILFVETLGVVGAHWSIGFWSALPGGGWEDPAIRAIALLALSLLGDGSYALSERVKAAVRDLRAH